jgi:CRP/FNR family transcriptional regulator, cyclic AMP receptor protein
MEMAAVPLVTPLSAVENAPTSTAETGLPGLRLVGDAPLNVLARLANELGDTDGPLQLFKSGEALFHQGHPGGALYLLQRGAARSSARTNTGALLSTRVHHPLSLLGLTATVAPNLAHCETVHAVTPCAVRIVNPSALAALRERCDWIDHVIIDQLGEQLRTMVKRTVNLCSLDSPSRVAAAVLQAVGTASTVAVTQDVIAELAGVARPTANTALRDFEHAEVIALARGRITVLQRASLERLIGSAHR